jgi:hypothetical protein
MRYCITEGDIDMVISEWPEEWRIPAITQEVSERTTEEEAEQGETQPPEIQVPKKPRTGQGKPTQVDEGPKKKGPRRGRRRIHSRPKEQQKQAEGAQETTSNPNTQEPGGNKRPTTQTGGSRARNQRHKEHLQNIRSQMMMGR